MAFRKVRTTHPFHVDALVVLPDHLHCIWALPPGDADFATRWRFIKTLASRDCFITRLAREPKIILLGDAGEFAELAKDRAA